MKKLKVLGLLAICALLFASTASGAEFIKPSDDGDGTVTLPSTDTHHNLYTVGGNVIVNSRTTGDLVAAGGMIKVTGEVTDDLILGGGNIDVSGRINGNARIAGGNISISGPIASDLLVGGGNIFVSDTASITGDFVAGGGNINLNASVGGYAKIAGGSVTINSAINGELWVSADQKLIFGPNARVNNKISYYGNSDPIIEPGAQVGTIERHALAKRSFYDHLFAYSLFGAGVVISLIAWLLGALLLMYLVKPQITQATTMMRSEPWANFGIGLVTLIVAPILSILLLVTVIGYHVAFLVMAVYFLTLLLSCTVAAVFVGRFIYGYLDHTVAGVNWKVVVLGVIVYKTIMLIPIVGWILAFILSISAFGVLLRMLHQRTRRQE